MSFNSVFQLCSTFKHDSSNQISQETTICKRDKERYLMNTNLFCKYKFITFIFK